MSPAQWLVHKHSLIPASRATTSAPIALQAGLQANVRAVGSLVPR